MTELTSSRTLVLVDALQIHDREEARRLTPAEKLEQALETMRSGIRLKRLALCRRYPDADDSEIDRRLADWLADG
jgi:hypothetical protein